MVLIQGITRPMRDDQTIPQCMAKPRRDLGSEHELIDRPPGIVCSRGIVKAPALRKPQRLPLGLHAGKQLRAGTPDREAPIAVTEL